MRRPLNARYCQQARIRASTGRACVVAGRGPLWWPSKTPPRRSVATTVPAHDAAVAPVNLPAAHHHRAQRRERLSRHTQHGQRDASPRRPSLATKGWRRYMNRYMPSLLLVFDVTSRIFNEALTSSTPSTRSSTTCTARHLESAQRVCLASCRRYRDDAASAAIDAQAIEAAAPTTPASTGRYAERSPIGTWVVTWPCKTRWPIVRDRYMNRDIGVRT